MANPSTYEIGIPINITVIPLPRSAHIFGQSAVEMLFCRIINMTILPIYISTIRIKANTKYLET